MIDRTKFFSSVRSGVFHGHMNQQQVDGMNFILDSWEGSGLTDLRWIAYMLGTAYHETAATMQPIKEYGSYAYFITQYDVQGRRPDTARAMGNTQPGDGPRYCGRGFIQCTWKVNYARGGAEIGVNLVDDPDLAMQPDIAAKLMFAGMTKRALAFQDKASGTWTFTGKALEDYFNDRVTDWVGARRIINGTDHADMIGATAKSFYAAVH